MIPILVSMASVPQRMMDSNANVSRASKENCANMVSIIMLQTLYNTLTQTVTKASLCLNGFYLGHG